VFLSRYLEFIRWFLNFSKGMTRCGDMKITMGTGGFVDLNTGSSPFPSSTGDLSWKKE